MAEINLQCNNLSQTHSSVFFRLKIVWQVEHTWGKCWTKFGWNSSRNEWVIGQTSECTKRENFRGSRKPTKKCAMKMKETRIRKWHAHKNIVHRKKPFIAPIQETGENDLHEPWGDDCGYNEGTIRLVGGLIVGRGMVFRAWAHKRTPLNSQWLVLRIGGTDLLHCCVADSVWLERAESLITNR